MQIPAQPDNGLDLHRGRVVPCLYFLNLNISLPCLSLFSVPSLEKSLLHSVALAELLGRILNISQVKDGRGAPYRPLQPWIFRIT